MTQQNKEMKKLLKQFKKRYGFLPTDMKINEERRVEMKKGEDVLFEDMAGALLNNFSVSLTYWDNGKDKDSWGYIVKKLKKKDYIKKKKAFQSLLKRMKTCILCKKEFEGFGNNSQPLKEGLCCEKRNLTKVIPARFKKIK